MDPAHLPPPNAPAVRPARRRLTSRDGFTLIELVVTLAVIAIGVVATHRVFLATLDATVAANARTRASAIATREVEEVQAIPYAEVGLPTGSPAGFEDADTVVVDGSSIPHTGPAETIDGVVFSITRWVVWEPGTSAYPDAIKRVVAIVGWTDEAGHHDVRADAAVYPGGLGPYSGTATTTTTTVASTPGTPTNLAATTSAEDPVNQIELAWDAGSPVPTSWEIQLSTDGGVTYTTDTDTRPGSHTTYSVTGLAAETTYKFRVRGLNPSFPSGWSNVASASTVQLSSTCDVQSATANPGSVRKTGNHLFENVVLTVNVSGNCGTIRATFDTAPGATKNVVFSEGSNNDVYSHTIVKNLYADWSTGSKIVHVTDSSNDEIAQISLVVTT